MGSVSRYIKVGIFGLLAVSCLVYYVLSALQRSDLSGSSLPVPKEFLSCRSEALALPEPASKGFDNSSWDQSLPRQCNPESCQSDRQRRVKLYCDRVDNHQSAPPIAPWQRQLSSRTLKYILVDDRHRVLYCRIPKVACTNWMRVLYLLSGRAPKNVSGNATQILAKSVHNLNWYHRSVPSLSMFTKRERQFRLRHYYKFMFVRSPLERLLSAYRNKFGTNPESYFNKRYGVLIKEKFPVSHVTSTVKRSRSSADVGAHGISPSSDNSVPTKTAKKNAVFEKAYANIRSDISQFLLNRDDSSHSVDVENTEDDGDGSGRHTKFDDNGSIQSELVQRLKRALPANTATSINSSAFDRNVTTPTPQRMVTFSQFVAWIAEEGGLSPAYDSKGKGGRSLPNVHWDSFESLCSPCDVEYDFIGQYDRLDEEAAALLRYAFRRRDVEFPRRSDTYKHEETQRLLASEYSRVDPKMLQKLIKRYQNDFGMFGYSC